MNDPTKSLAVVAKQGIMIVASRNVLLHVFGFFGAIIVLWKLSVAQYGMVQLAFSVCDLVSVVLFSTLLPVIIADYQHHRQGGRPDHADSLAGQFFVYQLIMSCVLIVALWVGADLVAKIYGSPIAGSIRIAAMTIMFSPFRTMYSLIQQSKLKFSALALNSVIESAVQFFGLLLVVTKASDPLSALLWVNVGSRAVATLVTMPLVAREGRRLLRHPFRTGFLLWETFAKRGLWALLSDQVRAFASSARLWLIARLISAEAVGLFSLAQSLLGRLLSLFPSDQIVPYMGMAVMHERARLQVLYDRAVKYTVFAYVSIGIVAAVAVPPIIGVFFPKYSAAMGLFELMLVTLVTTGVSTIARSYITVSRNQKLNFFGSVGLLLSVLVFGFVGLRMFGMLGIAFEFVLSNFANLFIRGLTLKFVMPDLKIVSSRLVKIDGYDRELARGTIRGFLARARHPIAAVSVDRDILLP